MNHRYRRTLDGHSRGFSLIEVLIVLAIFGLVIAISIPMSSTAMGGYKNAGQAHAVAYQVALAKMRAAAASTRARVFVDLAGGTYRLESWDRTTSQWSTQGGIEQLPRPVVFGFGSVETPPPDTQGTIGQAGPCRDGVMATSPVVDGSSCVMFNSRGIPIDSTGAATAAAAVYLTDGTAVYATTVSSTGMTQLWWTPTRATSWQKQ